MICRACGDSYHLKCFDPTLDHKPKNVWRCPPCKENKKAIKEIKINEKAFAKPKNEKLFEGVHDDDCYICYNGGGEFFKLVHESVLPIHCSNIYFNPIRPSMLRLLQQSFPHAVPYPTSSRDPKR